MIQQDQPDDFVIATGETHSVQEFVECAFGAVDLDWQPYVKIDPRFVRPAEVDLLVGDASKAHTKLDWQPSVTFEGLVEMMVDADMDLIKQELHPVPKAQRLENLRAMRELHDAVPVSSSL
jgi:GDPmannose 4,6-dehydratase